VRLRPIAALANDASDRFGDAPHAFSFRPTTSSRRRSSPTRARRDGTLMLADRYQHAGTRWHAGLRRRHSADPLSSQGSLTFSRRRGLRLRRQCRKRHRLGVRRPRQLQQRQGVAARLSARARSRRTAPGITESIRELAPRPESSRPASARTRPSRYRTSCRRAESSGPSPQRHTGKCCRAGGRTRQCMVRRQPRCPSRGTARRPRCHRAAAARAAVSNARRR
jgi:hypothetical protein